MSCSHLGSIRAPNASDSVHRDECTQCFATPAQAAQGLNVCLTCFNAGCTQADKHNHSQRHFAITKHAIALNIKSKPKQSHTESSQETDAASTQSVAQALAQAHQQAQQQSNAEPEFDTALYCFACQRTINESEWTPLVRQAIDGVLSANSATRALDAGNASWATEEAPTDCEHTLTLQQTASPPNLRVKSTATCNDCELSKNLWLNLTSGHLGCSRKVWGNAELSGNAHAVANYEAHKDQPVVLKLGTLTAEGKGDCYCYACDRDVVDSQLVAHLSHFGIDTSDAKASELTSAQLELQLNQNLDLNSVLDANERSAQLLFGPEHGGVSPVESNNARTSPNRSMQ